MEAVFHFYPAEFCRSLAELDATCVVEAIDTGDGDKYVNNGFFAFVVAYLFKTVEIEKRIKCGGNLSCFPI